MKKLLFSFLLVLAALGMVGLGFYEFRKLNPNRHREALVQWVESRFNVKLQLGLIFPIVYPGIGLELKDVKVELPDPERVRPELFRAKSLKAVLDLNELARNRRIKIKEVILNDPEFYIELSPKEKSRFRGMVKPKTEVQVRAAAEFEKTWTGKIIQILKKRYPVKFDPQELLETNRVLISRAQGTIYDLRDKPKKLKTPMQFGNIELGLTKTAEKNTFSFWFGADHPYDQPGLAPLRFEGKGKMFLSLQPFDLKADFDEAKWGENPFRRISLELAQKEGKMLFTGVVAGKVKLEQGALNLKWAPIQYSRLQSKISLWGDAEYQYHWQAGENPWEKFFNVDEANITNFRMLVYDPAGKQGRILEPIMIGGAKVEVKGIQGSNPGWLRVSMPFPYQEPMGNLKPFPVAMEGRIKIERNWSKVEFLVDQGSLGANRLDQLDFYFSRGAPSGYSFKGKLDLRLEDLSIFKQLLLWKPIKMFPQARFMSFSGKGRVTLDFRYPEPGANRFWYEGVAKLHNVSYDPGMVLYPIEKFNGELKISPAEISMPAYWFSVSGMPISSDFIYNRDTKDHRPRFKVVSNVNELDLAQLFFSRTRKLGTTVQPGEPLGPVASIWRGEFTGTRVKYKKFVADSAKGKWKYKDRMVSFPNLTMKYQEGFFQDGGSWLDFRLARVSDFHFRGHLDNFQFKKIMDELFGYDFFVDGLATGEGYLSGRFVDGQLQKQSLNGYFKLVVRDGNLIGYNLGLRLLQFMGFKIDQSKGGLPFDRAKAELVFKDGVIYFDDIELRSAVLEAHCAGQVDLVHQSMKLWVSAYPLEVLATLTRPLPLVGALINQTQESLFGYYAKAEGPWSGYKITSFVPLTEKVPKAPELEAFPQRPYDPSEKTTEGVEGEKK